MDAHRHELLPSRPSSGEAAAARSATRQDLMRRPLTPTPLSGSDPRTWMDWRGTPEVGGCRLPAVLLRAVVSIIACRARVRHGWTCRQVHARRAGEHPSPAAKTSKQRHGPVAEATFGRLATASRTWTWMEWNAGGLHGGAPDQERMQPPYASSPCRRWASRVPPSSQSHAGRGGCPLLPRVPQVRRGHPPRTPRTGR